MQSKDDTCKPFDDSPLIEKPQQGGMCRENFKQFTLDVNGILRHHCSRKKVCPKDGATHRRASIVISSRCSDEDSKFIRTPGKYPKSPVQTLTSRNT